MLKIIEEEIYGFSGDSAFCVILNRENYEEKIHVKSYFMDKKIIIKKLNVKFY